MPENELLQIPTQFTHAASNFYRQQSLNIKHFSLTEMLLKHYKSLHHPSELIEQFIHDQREELIKQYIKTTVLDEYAEETREVREEVGVSRAVENFLCYISDALTQAMIAQPGLLKSQEHVTLEEVLEHESIADFIHWAADRHVNQLYFKGLGAIANYIEKRLGLKLWSNEEDWRLLRKATAVRNLIVHRRCRIDERFARAMGDSSLQSGERYSIPSSMIYASMACSMRLVRDFDARISEKFKIPLLVASEQDWYSAPNGPSALSRHPLPDPNSASDAAP
ncbi:hypothetical protein [Streptomyces qinglanensis]|uniref:hypothetical protein n=1 Tax=Streptomyces qinglanensis TaxID=943816 RepID=UPI001112F903|nr:hypothetical protein [Streptomyces qinglanensis]